MVRRYPRAMTADDGLRTPADAALTRGFARLTTMLSQFVCGVRGHDTLLHLEDGRMSLRCASCGHETPGWELNEAPPTITARADARRNTLARPQLVRERRIA